jgi:multiple sugar transport system permease protein
MAVKAEVKPTRRQHSPELPVSSSLFKQMRGLLVSASLTLFGLMVLSIFLMPLGYMTTTALKDRQMIAQPGAPILPSREATYEYEGKALKVYQVPTGDGIQAWALVTPGREQSVFVDPANPEAGLIEWTGRWRTLQPAWELAPQWGNFTEAWRVSNFGRLLRNTLLITIPSTIGAVVSSAIVAYGFARFRFPGKRLLFFVLLGTIILPFWVTLIPTYVVFQRIGWVGTFLPLIVPHFFANAWNVFLLRQYLMGIPRELDEAAMLDGAGPFRILVSIILPQAVPGLAAVTLFHFFFAWNDFFGPLIYLAGRQELLPISVGISVFNALYSVQPHMIQAVALMAIAIPVVVFFLAQNFFMQGVKITGVEK